MSNYYLQEASKCAKQAVECDLVGDLSRAQRFYQVFMMLTQYF